MYAIVDIETTGSYAAANGITEISIHLFDGEKVTEVYETLINPGQPIPRYIQAMTGITDEMVSKAPSFDQVAATIFSKLDNRIFVAHNVNFDYSFVRGHLKECGYDLKDKKLCTVRLSRKILPGHQSYSLGRLCHALGIPITNRHRAGGDTEATVKLFQLLLQHDKEDHVRKSLLRNSKEQILPPNVPKTHFEQLPYTPGVYYFHDARGKIIYVGKANNIRYRVNSHFSNNSEGRQKQNFLTHTHAITYTTCGTELMACILESSEIKKKWPVFNQAQKRWEDTYGFFLYEDQKGFLRIIIDKNRKRMNPVHTFHYLADGQAMLRNLIKKFNLCPKLCFIQSGNDECSGLRDEFCYGACEGKEEAGTYNQRVQNALLEMKEQPSFAIIDKGINGSDKSCILVEGGRFYGMGYVHENFEVNDLDALRPLLTRYKENSFIRNIVYGYASRFPAKVVLLANQATPSH